MQRIEKTNLQLWQFENLGRETEIDHFVTGRNSLANGIEFTLSFSSSPDKDLIRKHRNDLAHAMGVDTDRLFFPSQVHETRIVRVTRATAKEELMETDALITNDKQICIAVMSADCVPILLFDKKNKAVAAVHSGWRGTVAKILEKTLTRMREEFGTKGENLIAGIGPSVSQDSYEVGEEVVEAVKRSFGKADTLLIPQENNKAKLDLWSANRIQLREFGVPASSVEISELCTVKNNSDFFSARKGDTGRFAAGIMLR
jgi:polyphenol oxidase